jgi:hypothetical protein
LGDGGRGRVGREPDDAAVFAHGVILAHELVAVGATADTHHLPARGFVALAPLGPLDYLRVLNLRRVAAHEANQLALG